MHIRIYLEQRRLLIILFHPFLWDSFPAMLAFWPVKRIQLQTCLSHHSSDPLFTITKDNHISDKSGRPLFTAQCSGEIRHYGSFEIAYIPGSYFVVIFFYRKEKAKLCFLQQDFLIYKKKIEHELNELQCLHSCSFHCEWVQF